MKTRAPQRVCEDAPTRFSSASSLETTTSLARVARPVTHCRELSWAATVGHERCGTGSGSASLQEAAIPI
jgi:hypothetical protein